ncbi:isocitrate lyase/PEP mutase family protein [Fimbriimonas ginsengisoli]|uniref:Putative carboxyvinyl-carboxyphosphonate phosphorylmutase n=1 Tax=Fimbriimonas ginsengisoli Gsoil 348 TaxID=661478 RepID=A0A068NTP9_FIMGI|nr:isocitrate lyase/phosphoenolpyruvate mutase family protein [Fimbriimonas ginsengisoli]AIE86115.1 putative carboxyvinyl-carboxyphosphonate phosphorylmutase [Fimbriimonas ginsengisoli Gsoil 348]
MADYTARRAAFRKLHESGCFVVPNPWDIGSARYLETLGFKGLATTSAGFGFSRGLPDSVKALTREMVLAHVAEIVRATELPVNADFQAGYAATPEGVAESVRLCVETGVAGLSIEDATGESSRPLYDISEAVDRLAAARAAIDASGADVLLTARAECFLVGHPDPLNESIKRLRAYSDAGADVLFASGPRQRDQIRAIVDVAGPKPVNAIVTADYGFSVADMEEMGVRRISVGSALARTAWYGFIRAAKSIAEEGSFAGLEQASTFAELNALFESHN